MSLIELQTDRLKFRQFNEDDFETYAAYYADEKLARFIGGVRTRDEAWRKMASLIGHWALRGFGYWAVDEKETSEFVGCVGLWHSDGWPEMELGYWIMPEMQGKGYATEAGRKCKEFAFDVVKTDSLVSYIDPENKPSIMVAKRLGATYDKMIELLQYGTSCVYRHK